MAQMRKAARRLLSHEPQACLKTFQGFSDDEIVKSCYYFGDDPEKIKEAKHKLKNLRNTKKFKEYYDSLLVQFSYQTYGLCLERLRSQVNQDSDNWLSNKAANDLLAKLQKLVTGENENTVHIIIDGAPDLGTPSDANDG